MKTLLVLLSQLLGTTTVSRVRAFILLTRYQEYTYFVISCERDRPQNTLSRFYFGMLQEKIHKKYITPVYY